MKSSFNAYGRTSFSIDALSIPVWLGNVEPVPVGGVLDRAYLKAGVLYPAGTPINLTAKVIKPFVVMKVTAASEGVLTVDAGSYGIAPQVGEYVQKVSDDLSSLEQGVAITAVAATAKKGVYEVTVAVTASENDAVVLSPSQEGAAVPNAYLYNDIRLDSDADPSDESTAATGAAVVYHQSGILVDRTPASLVQKQMKALVPGVYQHND